MSYLVHKVPSFDAGMVSAFPMTIVNQQPESSEGHTKKLYNMDFKRIPGQLNKRPGTSKVFDPVTNTITGIHEYARTDTGRRYLVASHDTNIQYWDTEWIDIKTDLTAGKMAFINFANQLIFSNGEDSMYRWDGDNLHEIEDGPEAKYLAEFRGRLFAAGISDDKLLLKSSHPGDPILWDPHEAGSRAFEVYVSPDDGQKITGIMALDDYLLIGKERNLYGLFGTTTEDFGMFPIEHTTGVGSHWSMKSIRGAAYFVGSDGAIYQLRSGEPLKRISDPVNDYIDQVDLTIIDYARAAVFRGDQYIVSLPTDYDEYITLLFDTTTGRWAEWSIEMSHTGESVIEDRVYFTEPEGNQILRLYEGKLDDHDDSPVEAELETQDFHFGSIGIEKEIRTVFLRFRQTDVPTHINFYWKTDLMFDWSNPNVLFVGAGDGYFSFRVPLGLTNCREFRMKLENSEDKDMIPLGADIVFLVKEVE